MTADEARLTRVMFRLTDRLNDLAAEIGRTLKAPRAERLRLARLAEGRFIAAGRELETELGTTPQEN